MEKILATYRNYVNRSFLMQMKQIVYTPPMTIKTGDRIKQRRAELGLSQGDLAKICQWEDSRARISNYERNLRAPISQDIEILAKALKTSPSWLQFGEGDKDGMFFARKEVKSSRIIPTLSMDEVEGWLSGRLKNNIPTMPFISPHSTEYFGDRVFFVEVKGDSMSSAQNPRDSYAEGDFALIDPDKAPKEGMDVLFSHNETVKIRRIIKDGNELILKANNPQYPILKLDESIKILGIILFTQRDQRRSI